MHAIPTNSLNLPILAAVVWALLPCTLAIGQMGMGGTPQMSEAPREHAAIPGSGQHTHITPLGTLSRTITTSRPSSTTQGDGSETADETTLLQITQSLVIAHSKTIRPQPDANLATDKLMPIRLVPSGAKYEATLAKLELPVKEIDFRETPLNEAVAFLADKQGIEIDIDARSLEDFGIAPDVPVSLKASGISLRSAMRRMLRDCDLGFIVHNDGLVLVTTMEEEQDNLPIVAYPVPLLLEDDPTALIHLLQQTVAPTTWNIVGGQGAVTFRRNTLLIAQTLQAHDQILAVLRNYESAEFPQVADAVDRATGGLALRSYHIADDTARQDLAEQLVFMCNAVLGERGDPSADVAVIGSSIVVRSSRRAFHVYASQLIRSIVGLPSTTIEVIRDTDFGHWGQGGMGTGGLGRGMF